MRYSGLSYSSALECSSDQSRGRSLGAVTSLLLTILKEDLRPRGPRRVSSASTGIQRVVEPATWGHQVVSTQHSVKPPGDLLWIF